MYLATIPFEAFFNNTKLELVRTLYTTHINALWENSKHAVIWEHWQLVSIGEAK